MAEEIYRDEMTCCMHIACELNFIIFVKSSNFRIFKISELA